MKKILIIATAFIPALLFAATTATTGAAPAAATVPAVNTTAATGMLAQLPAFLAKLDTARGSALTVTEKAAVTGIVTQGNTSVNGIQSKFLGTASKISGLDVATLGLLFPSATQPVTNTEFSNKVENKLGSKLNYMQRSSLKAANVLRNSSLDGLKKNMTNGVAQKLGMDPVVVSSFLPLLGL